MRVFVVFERCGVCQLTVQETYCTQRQTEMPAYDMPDFLFQERRSIL